MTVHLAGCFNPDNGSFSYSGRIPPTETIEVKTLREARVIAMRYRDQHLLGGGHWGGGQVYDASGHKLAWISYNGRIWDPRPFPEAKEIAVDIDGAPLPTRAD